jgi:aminoglycoside 3-N-acetyltransferase
MKKWCNTLFPENKMLKQLALKYAPEFLLEWAKRLKKNQRRKHLSEQEKSDSGITKEQLLNDLRKIGLKENDSVLVHSSLSKIGFVKGGASTVISALEEAIGKEGTLLFPAFPAAGRNKDHLEAYPSFDILNTPSRMGSITEYFRKLEGVQRSFHPTDSVCAKGPLAVYFTDSHFGQLTPYNENSPFRKLCSKGGKILMLGTTLNGACTNLHTLEDAVDFKYPVYDKKEYEVTMKDAEGNTSVMKTKVHNPEYSAKRNCDALRPLFEKEGVLVNGMIGEAKSMLIDADKMLQVMIKYYREKGVTMYTPYGENN